MEQEPEEDLSSIEWGAGFARMLRGQYSNFFFFALGWSLLGCTSYMITGLHETMLFSKGSEVVFPLVCSIFLLILAIVVFFQLRKTVVLARAEARTRAVNTQVDCHAQKLHQESLWRDALGFGMQSTGSQRFVEGLALSCATIGIVGLGWALGLTTLCAYNKSDETPPVVQSLVYWQECYEFTRAWHYSDHHFITPSHLPIGYFSALAIALACTALGPACWFVLWKIVRQGVRPARETRRTEDGLQELPQTAMFALATSVGLIAGAGAWVFRQMIGIVHNIFFMQASLTHNFTAAFYYDANLHTPPPAPGVPLPLIILSPVIGGLVVAFLVQNWAPEAKGHGVPEVMDAIHYKKGKIRASVAGVKILASSFSIGSGGSVGREGPIIQIGSTFGSLVGTFAGCSVAQRVTLVACGAAGGIAATFNTPIGGMVFAVELMLPAANSRTLMPLGIAAVVSTYVGRAALGLHPAFDIPDLQSPLSSVESFLGLISFIPFGVIIGLVSVLFVKGIYWSEDLFDAMPGNYYSRHAIGMLGQGTLMFMMMQFSGSNGELGHYYIQGVGYATVRDVLSWVEPAMAGNGSSTNSTILLDAAAGVGGAAGWNTSPNTSPTPSISSPTFCMLLFLAKAVSTGMTIGSGASGGIFSPSLYLGVTMGGVWGHIVFAALEFLKPIGNPKATPFDPVQACVAGMAGMVGGSTGASLTAITMTFEMTRDYKTILPIIITTVMSHMTRKAISEDSIYTLKLVRRGHVVPEGLQAAFHAAQRVQDVMTSTFRVLGATEPMTKYAGVTLVRGAPRVAPPATAPFPITSSTTGASTAPLLAAGNGHGHAHNGGISDDIRDLGGDLDAVCGPVLMDHDAVFGRALRAAEFAQASGERAQLACVVGPLDDLNDCMRRMVSLDAEFLLVSRVPASQAAAISAADIIGVVTKTDVAKNVAAKSALMARDRSLGRKQPSVTTFAEVD